MSLIKTLHVIFALISITGFIYRSYLKLIGSNTLQQKWLKVLPHINDTLLLISAIYLVIASQYYPTWLNWVSVKIIALFLYIFLGLYTLRFSQSRQALIISFLLALLTFAYIISVALTKQVWPLVL
ncbi:MAG: SirB2 family protein [Thioalkalispiraceae bacterium]|jgi:uncharacterized membrane protein SirB2